MELRVYRAMTTAMQQQKQHGCRAVLFLFPADVNVSKDHVLLSLPQAKLSGHTKVNCLVENGVFTVNAQAESRME